MSRLSLVCLFVEDKWVTRDYIPSVIWCRNIRLHEAMKGPSYFVPRHFRLQEEGLSQRHNEGGGLSLASVSGQSPVMAHPRATFWLSFWVEFECNWKKRRQRHGLFSWPWRMRDGKFMEQVLRWLLLHWCLLCDFSVEENCWAPGAATQIKLGRNRIDLIWIK